MTVDHQSMFAATLVDELVRNGVTNAVLSPGKRATLVAAALERHPGIRTYVVVDERSAAFFALGLARRSGNPTLLWCTSGTAVAEYHPAVLEASHGCVPLIVATSDRPPEQRSVRDWQAIDQTRIFGPAVRWSFDFGVADPAMASSWRSIVSRACIEAMSGATPAGPVHVNIPIREPISLVPAVPVDGRTDGAPWHRFVIPSAAIDAEMVSELVAGLESGARNGVFVLGAGVIDAEVVQSAADALGWPVLTTARSTVRGMVGNVVAAEHAMLRSPAFADTHRPSVAIHVGEPMLSTALSAWLRAGDVEEWSVEAHPTWQGETQRAGRVIQAEPEAFLRALTKCAVPTSDRSWVQSWLDASEAAQRAISTVLADESQLCESAIARSLMRNLPVGSNLFASTSMPVRDLDWWSEPRSGVRVWANRGVSGLDGVTSTAMGIAAAAPDESTVLLIGDLGLLHDLNALWAFRNSVKDLQLVIVVIDNSGGGIFRSFPMARELGESTYQRIVATPQPVDIPTVAGAMGIDVQTAKSPDELCRQVSTAIEMGGVQMVYCRTDADNNIAVTTKLNAAVADAIE